jgi:hypothetical protein
VTESIRHDGEQRGSHALAEALQLQEAARQRTAATGKRRGKRRKGRVIDLDEMTMSTPKPYRWLKVVLLIESVIAVIAVGVLIAYLWFEGDQLQ